VYEEERKNWNRGQCGNSSSTVSMMLHGKYRPPSVVHRPHRRRPLDCTSPRPAKTARLYIAPTGEGRMSLSLLFCSRVLATGRRPARSGSHLSFGGCDLSGSSPRTWDSRETNRRAGRDGGGTEASPASGPIPRRIATGCRGVGVPATREKYQYRTVS
jgi:hypothetical protein